MSRYAFIGGTYRGHKLIEGMISNGHNPLFSIIMKEDEHEEIKCCDKISELLNKNKISYSIKNKLTAEDYELIKKSDLDFILLFGWRTLIDPSINSYLKFGAVAVHHSLLPLYRGFAPIHWSIINGEKETGVTLFQIEEGEADSGRIIIQEKIPILFEDYAWDLYQKMTQCTIEVCLEFFKKYDADDINLIQQDEIKATYCCKRIPEDGKISWSQSSVSIYNFVRALAHPFTGAFCEFNENIFHIRKAKLGKNNYKNYSGAIPGRVININSEGIEVLCKEGTILVTEWENKAKGVVNCPADIVKSINATLK